MCQQCVILFVFDYSWNQQVVAELGQAVRSWLMNCIKLLRLHKRRQLLCLAIFGSAHMAQPSWAELWQHYFTVIYSLLHLFLAYLGLSQSSMLYLLVVYVLQLFNTCGRVKLRIFEILGGKMNIFITSQVLVHFQWYWVHLKALKYTY